LVFETRRSNRPCTQKRSKSHALEVPRLRSGVTAAAVLRWPNGKPQVQAGRPGRAYGSIAPQRAGPAGQCL